MAKPKGKTTARGYGAAHQKLRAKAKKLVDAGKCCCWRCGKWLEPGQPFDLGHDDNDRTIYRGPECVACNRATARRRAGVSARATRDGQPRVRPCEVCGAEYKASTPDQRTCGRACGWELRRRNAPPSTSRPVALYDRQCTECSTYFSTNLAKKLTCSATCSKVRQRRWMREHYHLDPDYRAATIERTKQRRWAL